MHPSDPWSELDASGPLPNFFPSGLYRDGQVVTIETYPRGSTTPTRSRWQYRASSNSFVPYRSLPIRIFSSPLFWILIGWLFVAIGCFLLVDCLNSPPPSSPVH